MPIQFIIPAAKRRQVDRILADAIKRGLMQRHQLIDIEMSLCACIAHGTPLDLDVLAGFDDFSLAHDLHGIKKNFDSDDDSPTAGQLLNNFRPFCAVESERKEAA